MHFWTNNVKHFRKRRHKGFVWGVYRHHWTLSAIFGRKFQFFWLFKSKKWPKNHRSFSENPTSGAFSWPAMHFWTDNVIHFRKKRRKAFVWGVYRHHWSISALFECNFVKNTIFLTEKLNFPETFWRALPKKWGNCARAKKNFLRIAFWVFLTLPKPFVRISHRKNFRGTCMPIVIPHR